LTWIETFIIHAKREEYKEQMEQKYTFICVKSRLFLSLFSPLRFIQIGHFRLWREKRERSKEREWLEMFGGVRSESEKCGFMCGRAADNEKKIVGVMNMHKVWAPGWWDRRAAAWEKVPKGVSENKQRTKGDTAESDQPSKPMHIHQALQSLLYLALGPLPCARFIISPNI
jgi:hypothetical protein